MRGMFSSPPKKNEALSVDFHGAALGKWADIFGLEDIQPLNPHHKISVNSASN